MISLRRLLLVAASLFVCGSHELLNAQFVQEGGKLVGTGSVGNPVVMGIAVALSADGNTAIVGGDSDSGGIGAAWVFTRDGESWSQEAKLVGTGAVGSTIYQGISVSLSSDGNTALVGGSEDSAGVGAAWVFTRTGGLWSQQGNKLVGTGGVGNSSQGWSVSISSDGNTALVGGYTDSGGVGAAWVYTRTGGVWSQQGNKLVGGGFTGDAWQGYSVALSADGNTAIVAGPVDNSRLGAAWVYTRNGGVWVQQGSKLVGAGAVGGSRQGYSVSLSSDGNTAIVAGPSDNSFVGASWVYTRSGAIWSQQGNKLVGTGVVGISNQGWGVSLSGDGNTAIVGGYSDNNSTGAAWVFVRSGGAWVQLGEKLVGSGAVGGAIQGRSVALSLDGRTALVGGPGDNNYLGAAWVYTRTGLEVGRGRWQMPGQLRLHQNYPNPFNPSTTIMYELPKASMVRLSVYDILGREVSVLVNERKNVGTHEVRFDAAGLSSGVYLYRLQAGEYTQARRLIVLK